MDDLKTLSVKPDVEHDIEHLENLSRGWFETDEDFQARCDCEVKEAANLYAAKMKKSSGKGGGGSWSTVATSGKKPLMPSSKGKSSSSGFSALSMLDD
eukprot:gene5156-34971_t